MISVTVFDSAGRPVIQKQRPLSRDESLRIELGDLHPGAYVLSARGERASATAKVVVTGH